MPGAFSSGRKVGMPILKVGRDDETWTGEVSTSLMPSFVVMLNWNQKEDTIACVESVLAAGVTPERVVVVDNSSTDDSVEEIVTRFGPSLCLVCNERNLGYSGGMNVGIRHALERGAASVLLLNNDTVIAPTMIDLLSEADESLDGPGILGPSIYYYDEPERLWRLGDRQSRWLPMPLRVKLEMRKVSQSIPVPVDYVTGCGMLVRTEVFESIGLFDRRYFIYYEDADFCRRALDAGFSVWCVPQAKMWHKVSLATRRDKPFFRYHRAVNQIRFYHEHSHGPSPLLRESYIAFKFVKALFEDVLNGDWNLIGPLWKGTMDGYKEQWRRRREPGSVEDVERIRARAQGIH
jgi:GT2 family glycosyltransferase